MNAPVDPSFRHSLLGFSSDFEIRIWLRLRRATKCAAGSAVNGPCPGGLDL
jgi:hypothetical protein